MICNPFPENRVIGITQKTGILLPKIGKEYSLKMGHASRKSGKYSRKM